MKYDESLYLLLTWNKVFKSGPSKICGRQPLKNLKGYMVCLSKLYPFKFVKGCVPQILLGPLLNTWTHISHLLVEFLWLTMNREMFVGGMVGIFKNKIFLTLEI